MASNWFPGTRRPLSVFVNLCLMWGGRLNKSNCRMWYLLCAYLCIGSSNRALLLSIILQTVFFISVLSGCASIQYVPYLRPPSVMAKNSDLKGGGSYPNKATINRCLIGGRVNTSWFVRYKAPRCLNWSMVKKYWFVRSKAPRCLKCVHRDICWLPVQGTCFVSDIYLAWSPCEWVWYIYNHAMRYKSYRPIEAMCWRSTPQTIVLHLKYRSVLYSTINRRTRTLWCWCLIRDLSVNMLSFRIQKPTHYFQQKEFATEGGYWL